MNKITIFIFLLLVGCNTQDLPKSQFKLIEFGNSHDSLLQHANTILLDSINIKDIQLHNESEILTRDSIIQQQKKEIIQTKEKYLESQEEVRIIIEKLEYMHQLDSLK